MKPHKPDDEPIDDDAQLGDETAPTGDATEETLQLDSTSDRSTVEITGPSTIHPFGIGKPRVDDADDQHRTVENVEATIDMKTVQLRPNSHQTKMDSAKLGPRPQKSASVMSSADVSQTIDPRELSKEDAAFWGSVALNASQVNEDEKSKLRPAVERSLSESKLQIRERDLAVPTRDPNSPSDYRLVRLLGRGGMGNVYVARQGSLDRMIAVKVIKPLSKAKRQELRKSGRLEAVEHERRQQFLSEAVVTGDLDHPNIVPIHDMAVAADNTLFYAMKRVVGQPWLKTIKEKTRDENLEILLKVCDAIAFAHTRGVIHRDIKPENIMLGDFGEVLVMDWGLALAKPEFEKKDSISVTAGLGGTPAFMSPEMAIGPVEAIGVHSDIYLLGATLFYIITGNPPHKAENVSQCIRAVASNTINKASPDQQGELLNIALHAMETDPKDRYESVKDFQAAIRKYRSHSESIALSTAAEAHYQNAIRSGRYESFSRAIHGFEQSIALWDGNQFAIAGLARCKVDHAEAAYANGDYDLGLSLLDEYDSSHHALIEKLTSGIKQREQRAIRFKLLRRVVAASLLFILVGGSVALYIIDQERNEANSQRAQALHQKGLAESATIAARQSEQVANKAFKQADKERSEKEVQRKIALANAEDARKSEAKAKTAAEKAEYESYLSQIGLAKARIDGNEFDDARAILTAIRSTNPDATPAWEWRYLWEQANQSRSVVGLGAGVVDIAAARDGGFVIAVCDDGSVHRALLRHGRLVDTPSMWIRRDADATCVALRSDDGLLAIGTRTGRVILVDAASGKTIQPLSGHTSRVNDLAFIGQDRLLTGSTDRTVALWDTDRKQRIAECWHIAPVVALAAHPSQPGEPDRLIVAVSDAKTGRVVGWQIERDSFIRIGEFLEHEFPVASIALSEDGQLAASGDVRGYVALWSPDDLRSTDFNSAIKDAIATIGDENQVQPRRLVSSNSPSSTQRTMWRAHQDAVAAMQLDGVDGTLLTGANDYTIRVWNLSDQSLNDSFRGHGGWVRALQLAPTGLDSPSRSVVSGSVDGTLRTWGGSAQAEEVETANLDPIAIAEVEAGETRQRESQLHRDEILAARFDASGTRVITASRDHTAKVFGIDPNTMSIRKIASINTGLRDSSELNEGTDFLAMSAQSDTSGKRLFVGSADSTIRIWDVDSGIELGSLTGTGLNNAFALSRDGRYLLSGSSRPDAKAILWNVASDLDQPIAVHRLGGHDQAVTAFAISSDGGILVTGDRSGRCQVWDNASGMRVGEPIDRFRGFRINELAISSDDASLWVATDIGQLTEIDLISRERRRQLEHDGFVTSFSLSPNGDRAVTVSTLTSTKSMVTSATLWDLRTGNRQPLGRVEAELDQTGQSTGSQARINSARFSRDGSRVVICRQGIGGRVGQVTIEDLASSTNKTFGLPPQIGAPEVGLMLGTNRLITLNGEAAFRWSIEGMIHEKSYRPHAAVTNACFSPDDSIAATASRSIRLWDTRTGESIDKLENPHGGAITSLDFSNRVDTDGLVFASSGADGSARLWTWKDRETGFRERRELGNGATAIRLVRFTPDGRNVMIAGENGMLQVSSLDDPAATSIRTLPEGLSATCAAFSSDGRFLAVGVTDKSAWLFDLNPDAATKPRVMRGHADRIESICVLEDPSDQIRVLTASRDKSARVWDPKLAGQEAASDGSSPTIPGREILSLRRHTQGVTAIDCTSDGELVMTAARDGRVMLWPAKLP